MKNNINFYQQGKSHTLTLFLLIVVTAIISYLFWTGQIGQVSRAF